MHPKCKINEIYQATYKEAKQHNSLPNTVAISTVDIFQTILDFTVEYV